MHVHNTTTPFGRRPVTLGQIAAQLQASKAVETAGRPGSNQPAAVNKWALFRTLAEVKDRLGVSDRALSVLNALLSFHPETALSLPAGRPGAAQGNDDGAQGAGQGAEAVQGLSCDLTVFPSNKALCLRAHGMAETTLRRHLAALVEAGLIIRRDSPNGKRYARKDASGRERFSDAFGFDLTALVTRAGEFSAMAEELRRDRRALALAKERISLHRRDIAKLIACGLDEGLPGDWEAFRRRFMMLVMPLRRLKRQAALAQLEAELAAVHAEVAKVVEDSINLVNMPANDSQDGRHQSNSNTQPHKNFEPASNEDGREARSDADRDSVEPKVAQAAPLAQPSADYPLGMVVNACPDIADYHAGGPKIRTWPQFLEAARLLRPMLGISRNAWAEAIAAMGEQAAAIAVAAILQRSEYSSEARTLRPDPFGPPQTLVNGSPAVKSPGGYLRALTEKAGAGEFALGPILMALLGQRAKTRRAQHGSRQ